VRALSRDAHRPLIGALRKIIGGDDAGALAARLGTKPTGAAAAPLLLVESLGCVPWASATFVGQTHWLEIRLEGRAEAVELTCRDLEMQLHEAEFFIPGNIVADVAVLASPPLRLECGTAQCSLRLEILTIED
jgi:hypothetical protein